MELKILQIDDACTGCGACANICPKKCISIKPNNEGFYYPTYNADNCIDCHLCEQVCHVINPNPQHNVSDQDFYMYSSKDMKIREKSSSGGAFTLFAQNVIDNDGVVFGCYYNGDKERLEFDNSQNVNWETFRKSKYIEAFTGDSFSQVATFLKQSKKVFFCGTPCQVKGLKRYLDTKKVDCTNLLTADFICHGVPSNLCFTHYKRKHETHNKKVVSVDSRHKEIPSKKLAWHNYILRLDFSNGTSKVIPYKPPYHFEYCKLFMDNIILRRCCYTCAHPSTSCADVTFADFWGIYKYKPEIDDNTGISIIKLHTPKAKSLWDTLPAARVAEPLPYSAVEYIYRKPDKTKILDKRTLFFSLMNRYGYHKAIRVYYKKEFVEFYTIGWVKQTIKNIIGRS